MNPEPSTPAKNAPPRLSLEGVILVLSDRTRWALIEALASGEPRMVNELAAAIGKSEASVSKHLAILRQLGLTQFTRRAHQLTEAFRPGPGETEIDFGYCVMRFPESVR
jgi:predicted transcriptional regulator